MEVNADNAKVRFIFYAREKRLDVPNIPLNDWRRPQPDSEFFNLPGIVGSGRLLPAMLVGWQGNLRDHADKSFRSVLSNLLDG